jgi:hypothetical protein
LDAGVSGNPPSLPILIREGLDPFVDAVGRNAGRTDSPDRRTLRVKLGDGPFQLVPCGPPFPPEAGSAEDQKRRIESVRPKKVDEDCRRDREESER